MVGRCERASERTVVCGVWCGPNPEVALFTQTYAGRQRGEAGKRANAGKERMRVLGRVTDTSAS